MRRLNLERFELLKKALLNGATTRDLMQLLGVTKQRVHQLLIRYDLGYAAKEFDKQWPKERRDAFAKMYEERIPYREIQKHFNLTYHQAVSVAMRFGLTRHLNRSSLTKEEQYINLLLIQARRRGPLDSNLNLNDLVPLPTHCPILGLQLVYNKNIAGVRADEHASLDQVQPQGGYVKGNVAIISNKANRLKNNGTADEHRKIADFMDTFK